MSNFPQGLRELRTQDDKDLFERVWKIMQECGEEERHFNQLQSVYRGIASTWFLATVGAVGYLLFNKDFLAPGKAIATEHLPFAASVCFAGMLGFVLLWVLDLQVYHQLLRAAFYEGLVLEDEFPWLPKIRTNMQGIGKKENDDKDPIFRKLLNFYVIGTYLMALGLTVCSGWSIGLACGYCIGWISIAVIGVVAVVAISKLRTKTLTEAQLLQNVTISPRVAVVTPNTTEQLRAIGKYNDGSRRDITDEAKWSSSDDSVASVDDSTGQKGLLKGKSSGAARITVESGVSRCEVTVKVGVLVSVSITAPSNAPFTKGSVHVLAATGGYDDGSKASLTQASTWSTSDPKIVEVGDAGGSKGRITLNGTGVAKIIAAFGGIRGDLDVAVS